MTIGMITRGRHRSRVLAAVVVAGLLGPMAAACTADRDPPPPTGTTGATSAPAEAGPDAGRSAPVADTLYPQYGNGAPAKVVGYQIRCDRGGVR